MIFASYSVFSVKIVMILILTCNEYIKKYKLVVLN